MKQSINFTNFVDAFHSMGRGEQFSYDALKAIFEYFESIEETTGEEQELDVIAICCDFSEMSIDEIIASYSIDVSECEDRAEQHQIVSDYLNDYAGFVAETSNESYVFLQF